MTRALEDFAQEADAVAGEQRQIAHDAVRLERQRDEGRSWAEVLGGADAGHLLRRVRSSGRRLATATGDLMRSLARELRNEGLSHRKIGRLLGVTHQRVTTILKSRSST
jgi:phosphoglycolate phosphatase-like HAD superfamily hydrolase